ncbi:hypothetical protein KP509_23G034400 [Ceratopteris richardii]|uniref:DUF4408 domain-containing protein n=1 Tax=Ceratopteris richardii TaxID=49495 RepID=A0A8T2RYI1_CERRI|nr:hypothetical protein KP509_23G034400 [Ceratopteris richardii]
MAISSSASSSMSKYQQQLLRVSIGAGLSLPAISLFVVLSGFSFSLTLPASLQALLPAVESLFMVSLPHLWKASLSWVTPPCLFVLLNGIIVILAATSGRSVSTSADIDSDMEVSFSSKLGNVSCRQGVLEFQAASPIDTSIPSVQFMRMHAVDKEKPRMQMFVDGPDEDDDKQIALQTNPIASTPSVETFGHCHKHIEESIPSAAYPCRDTARGASEPTSPNFTVTPPLQKNGSRRSLSMDSSPLADGDGDGSEQLSEEAFRKKIEDFIFKVNSKIRSETRVK